MNCTQNEKLNQVTPHTLIVGVDIAKFKHVARAQDDRGKMALATLEYILLPGQLNQTTPERVAEIWSTYGGVQRPSLKRIQRLQEAAARSVGLNVGLQMAQREIATNIKRYKMLKEELCALEKELETLVLTLPGIAEMLTVPGVGMVTVIELYSELGDIKNFKNPRQILKYAGLNLRESSSGKHKGQARITKRGRAKLRAFLFRTVMPLVRHNRAFKALHQYYTTRQENPLRKKQSLIVLCGKLVRVLHTVGQKQCPFDEERMIQDIPHLSLVLKV
jgi:transposase